MKTNIIISIYIAFAILITACKHQDGVIKQNLSGVFINREQMENSPDSTTLSFAIKPEDVQQDTVWISMRISGNTSNYDRHIPIYTNDTLTTAKPGEDFDIRDAIVKAGEYTARIPVVMYKTAKLKEKELRIYLEVGTNSDFPLAISGTQKLGSQNGTSQVNFIQSGYLIKLNNELKMPDTWYISGSWFYMFFGEFSLVKWKFILETTKRLEWGEGARYGSSAPSYQAMNEYIAQLLFALDQYEQTNGPLIDENGNRVTF